MTRKKRKRRIIKRIEIYPIPYVMERIIVNNRRAKCKPRQNFDGHLVYMTSQRLQLFKLKGLTCVCCALKATFFALEQNVKDKHPHLNLYGWNKNGDEVLFTKDHIIPKSKGGKNHIDNYQVMCTHCNSRKGNRTEEQFKQNDKIAFFRKLVNILYQVDSLRNKDDKIVHKLNLENYFDNILKKGR
jgi:5-methylcytosine-specific restriction endonuclease McrA